MFGSMLRDHCQTQCDCSTVTSCRTVAETFSAFQSQPVDCLVLSPGLSGEDAFQLVAPARRSRPNLPVVVVASRIDQYTLLRMERLQLETLVDVGMETVTAVSAALEAARQGRSLLTRRYLAAQHAWHSGPASAVRRLTERECEVLSHIGLGLDDGEIGLRLGLGASTVKWHRSEILRRLGLATTAKLVAFASAHGFVRNVGAA